MGASAEGLQAKTKLGAWIDVNPKPDQIVVNIGEKNIWRVKPIVVSVCASRWLEEDGVGLVAILEGIIGACNGNCLKS